MPTPNLECVYPHGLDYYPVEPFQRRVIELRNAGYTLEELAQRAGWVNGPNANNRSRRPGSGDASRLERALGMRSEYKTIRGREYRSLKRYVTYDVAVRLCRALELDYHTIGV